MLDVLLPTKGRADKLAAVAQNLKETMSHPYGLYFICENSDPDSCKEAAKHAKLIKGEFGSPAKAINHAFESVTHPYFLLANDDFVFNKTWLDEALKKMDDKTHVVGINNGQGNCTTIHLIKTSYVNDPGGTMDLGKGTVYYPYGHDYVDLEFDQTARHRGVLKDAPESVIDHIHPSFGMRPSDKVDRHKHETLDEDGRTFQSRRHLWNAA